MSQCNASMHQDSARSKISLGWRSTAAARTSRTSWTKQTQRMSETRLSTTAARARLHSVRKFGSKSHCSDVDAHACVRISYSDTGSVVKMLELDMPAMTSKRWLEGLQALTSTTSHS
eukprot:2594341-Prymnesium_polylepis.1